MDDRFGIAAALREATALADAGQTAEAERRLSDIASVGSSVAIAYRDLAITALRRGENDRAVALSRQAIAFGSRDWVVHANMGIALLTAILFIYFVLASQFESFIHPMTIMLALPLAIVGALLGLFLTNHSIGMPAMIGIILLMGLVTKNAILLVDYTNELRGQGRTMMEALLEAGPTRVHAEPALVRSHQGLPDRHRLPVFGCSSSGLVGRFARRPREPLAVNGPRGKAS